MVVTREILEAGKSSNGGWSEEQLKALGTHRRFNKGWYARIIGSDISEEKVKLFLSLKNGHIRQKMQLRFNSKYPWMIEGVNPKNKEQWLAMIYKKNPWLKTA